MGDIFEAIEQLSALLSFRIENAARERGWATKPYSWIVAPEEAKGKMAIVVATTLFLPEGLAVSFTPRAEPAPGGTTWPIDVRRTDSVVRESWAEGMSVVKNEKKFKLWYRSEVLSEQTLAALLDDLGKP